MYKGYQVLRTPDGNSTVLNDRYKMPSPNAVYLLLILSIRLI